MGSTRLPKPVTLVNKQWFIPLALFALIAFHAIANYWWLKTDAMPPIWDEAAHAYSTVEIARLHFLKQPLEAIRAILTTEPYPPFSYLISAVFVRVSWPSTDAMLGASALYMAVLIVSCYGIARRMAGQFAGLIAAFVVSMYPILFGLSRHYLLDFNLTAMTALIIWLLFETKNFSRRVPSFFLGIALGLGMLTKWTLVAFIAGPFGLIALSALFIKDGVMARPKLKNMALALVIGVCIAAPWYAANFNTLREFLKLVVNSGLAEGDPAINSLESWLMYFRHLTQFQILAPFTFLFIFGLVLSMVKRKNWQLIAALLLWIILPYIYFSLSMNKDTRYTLPYLPAMAALSGVGLSVFKGRTARAAIAGLIVAYALFEFAGLTIGLHQYFPNLPTRLEAFNGVTTLTYYAEDTHIASPPKTGDWKVHDLLDAAVSDAQTTNRKTQTGLYRYVVLQDIPYISTLTLRYWARMENLPLDLVFGSGIDNVDLNAIILSGDYVMTKTGNQGPEWTTKNSAKYSALLANPTSELAKQFTPIAQIPLPDGSTGTIYRRN